MFTRKSKGTATRKTASLLSTLGLTVGIVSIAASPSAAADETDSYLSEEQVQEVSANIDRAPFEVSDSDKQAILDKLKKGEIPESADPNASPVSTERLEDDNWVRDVYRFSDGSFKYVSNEKPSTAVTAPEGPSARSVSDCTQTSSGSWIVRTGCTIRFDDASGYLQYKMDAQHMPGQQGAGKINLVYGVRADGVMWEAGSAYAKIVKASGNPAIAEAGVSYTVAYSGGTVVGLTYVDAGGINQSGFPY